MCSIICIKHCNFSLNSSNTVLNHKNITYIKFHCTFTKSIHFKEFSVQFNSIRMYVVEAGVKRCIENREYISKLMESYNVSEERGKKEAYISEMVSS